MKRNNKAKAVKGTVWTKEECRREAEGYRSLLVFEMMSPEAYAVSVENGWIRGYGWLAGTENARTLWTEEACRREAEKYTTLKDFRTKSPKAYNAAKLHGWADSYSWLVRAKDTRKILTYEDCYEEAKRYSYFPDFRMLSRKAYRLAAKKGWLADYTWLSDYARCSGGDRTYWTEEHCRIEAMKYRTLREFRTAEPGAYQIAARNGWIGGYGWMESERRAYYTFRRCHEAAKAYMTEDEFRAGAPAAYGQSVKKGWIKDFTWLAEKPSTDANGGDTGAIPAGTKVSPKKKKPPRRRRADASREYMVFQYDMDGNLIGKFRDASTAARGVGMRKASAITKCLDGKAKTAWGYMWKRKQEA